MQPYQSAILAVRPVSLQNLVRESINSDGPKLVERRRRETMRLKPGLQQRTAKAWTPTGGGLA
jgi:hypothetical protein